VAQANEWIIEAAVNGVSEQLIPYDDAFAETFARTVPGAPLFVSNDIGDDYYAVPFGVKGTGVATSLVTGGTTVVVLVDADDGSFTETSWVRTPVEYLPVSKDEAIKIACEVLKKLGIDPAYIEKATVELVHIQSTPYYPHWRITGDKFVILIGQDRTITIMD